MNPVLIVTVTVVIGGLWAFAIGKSIAARRQPVTVGPEEIIGMEGVVRERGNVFVRGRAVARAVGRVPRARTSASRSTRSTA